MILLLLYKKNSNRLLFAKTKSHIEIFYCERRLYAFREKGLLKEHEEDCD